MTLFKTKQFLNHPVFKNLYESFFFVERFVVCHKYIIHLQEFQQVNFNDKFACTQRGIL
jgi:hypothetical protein